MFHTQCFQGYAGEKGQDNINSTQFPQDLEMWAMLCVAFLCKILMSSFQSSLKRVLRLLEDFVVPVQVIGFETQLVRFSRVLLPLPMQLSFSIHY